MFQYGHFPRPLVLHLFHTLSVKYKLEKSHLNATSKNHLHVSGYKYLFRIETGQLLVRDSTLTSRTWVQVIPPAV